jgi:iron complex transport system permease protein
VLVTVGVGAGLSLSGALLQGVFRNGLASPSILGISSGAMVGASVAVLVIGGYGPGGLAERAAGVAPLVVSGLGFAGALATALLVTVLATRSGRVSVPTLLLVGIAINACLGGVLAAIQSLTLREDFEVARAIFSWTFGSLSDRSGVHAAIVWSGVALAALSIPFVALELDLFAAGEDDAHGLGVDTARVKLLALGAASLAAGVAVAVAGQIAFVGLVVPHLLRLVTGASHKSLLPLCLVGGPVLLLGADLVQRSLLADAALQPGVTMSLIGGPFFLLLLVRNRGAIRSW